MSALAISALGQVTGGRVSGTITDSTGAVISGAAVKLESFSTGQTLTTQTSSAGAYAFPNVPVGTYMMSVESNGFQGIKREVKVVLNQESTSDIALQVNGVSGTVDINAASEALLQTDSSQLGQSYDGTILGSMPFFGNRHAAALLSPNIVEQSAGIQGVGGAVGGTRPRGNTFNLDGIDNNDPSITGPSTKVIPDAVQEFTLLNNNFNAEFGAGAGGQFNTITKSGTNQYHGSGFFYLQNEILNAAPSLVSRQFFRDQRFGGTIGGPIIKDKLFFFGAYSRERIRQRAVSTRYLAPTSAGLDQIASLPGASSFVVDLLRNNLTLASSATGTQTVLGTAVPFGEVVTTVPAGSTDDLFQVNIDHNPNSRDQFRHRFSFGRTRGEQAGGGGAGFNNLLAYDTQLFSSTWVRTFGASLVNDARIAYRRIGENYPLKKASASNFPNIVVTQLNLNLGPNTSFPQGAPVNNYYQLYDALTWIKGRHNFKFGGEMRRLVWSVYFLQFARGNYDYADFDQLVRDQAPGNQALRGAGSSTFTGNNFQYHGFAQDDWKFTPNLTFNIGVRYEYSSLPRDLAAQQLNALASVPGVVDFRKPKTDRNNFAPRVGFAYSPEWNNTVGNVLFGKRGQSAIRAHFGVSYYDL
ncbi:MAG TPA: TonB-dependent receptor, partial [Blastocatellia bacterium]|nr:TonB-dependent receptor [Blastocatellia bacterium]